MPGQILPCLGAKVFTRVERGIIEDGPADHWQTILRPPQSLLQSVQSRIYLHRHIRVRILDGDDGFASRNAKVTVHVLSPIVKIYHHNALRCKQDIPIGRPHHLLDSMFSHWSESSRKF